MIYMIDVLMYMAQVNDWNNLGMLDDVYDLMPLYRKKWCKLGMFDVFLSPGEIYEDLIKPPKIMAWLGWPCVEGLKKKC